MTNLPDNWRLGRERPGFIPEAEEHLWEGSGNGADLVGFIPDDAMAKALEDRKRANSDGALAKQLKVVDWELARKRKIGKKISAAKKKANAKRREEEAAAVKVEGEE